MNAIIVFLGSIPKLETLLKFMSPNVPRAKSTFPISNSSKDTKPPRALVNYSPRWFLLIRRSMTTPAAPFQKNHDKTRNGIPLLIFSFQYFISPPCGAPQSEAFSRCHGSSTVWNLQRPKECTAPRLVAGRIQSFITRLTSLVWPRWLKQRLSSKINVPFLGLLGRRRIWLPVCGTEGKHRIPWEWRGPGVQVKKVYYLSRLVDAFGWALYVNWCGFLGMLAKSDCSVA